jgi:hypothetical protein
MSNLNVKRFREEFIRLMTAQGIPLTRVNGVRGAVYSRPDGQRIRVRTNTKPVLMTPVFDGVDFHGAVFALEGKVHAYCVPNEVIARDLGEAREKWITEDPEHRHDNRTPVVRFDGEGKAWNGFAEKWREYHLGESALEPNELAAAAAIFRRAVKSEHPSAIVHIAVDTGNGEMLRL